MFMLGAGEEVKSLIIDLISKEFQPVISIWNRNIASITADTTINFPTALPNGIYNLFYVRSVGTSDNGIPITFILKDNETWFFLNGSGWIQEANADAVGRRNIRVSKTGIYCGAGGYNKLSDGSYGANNNICIPYRIDLLLKL